MDLMCTPVTQLSLMFCMHFIGTILGGFLAVIPDRIGRRKSVIYGMAMSIASQIVMLFVPNILVRSICFFFMGIANLKNSQSYVWSSECVPFARRSKAFTIINVFDCVPTLVTGLFYLFIGRDWFTIYLINVIISITGFVLAFVCPESPRWLLYNNRQGEAIAALNYIAKFNRSEERIPVDARFEETLQLASYYQQEH